MARRAIISVSDKTGVVEFARALQEMGFEIISTGGTGKTLNDNGIKTINISDVTGFPECLDGRVKTLHPAIFGGLLAMRADSGHMQTLQELGIQTIDIVAVNLYPFKKTIEKPGVTLEEAIENIDIGGPSMIRAAAKNWQDVAVLVDPADYAAVIEELKEHGQVSRATKFGLAAKVFTHTGFYDTLIASFLRDKAGADAYPDTLSLAFEKQQDMRYGENPHQKAAFYRETGRRPGTLVDAVQLHGKELSYNNINDTNGALELLREFNTTAVVAVKHANPCGVAAAETVYEAYMNAYNADPVSIFGGIVATNGIVDRQTAEKMSQIFLEIVVAKGFDKDALEVLTQKKNLRLLLLESVNAPLAPGGQDMKKVMGGLLVQDMNTALLNEAELTCVTERKPTAKELEDLRFAWRVVKHTKSNAIVIAKDNTTLGIGPGQVNRIWAAQAAIERSGEGVKGAVMASDAFFPFPDCAEAAAAAGITAIIQPGGSVRDAESIAECDKHGIAMLFTGMRHFRH